MKKYTLLCAGLCMALAFTSCKSSESAYRKAYEKAKAQEQSSQTAVAETPVVTPVVTKPANETTVVGNVDNVAVRQEQLTIVSGAGLKAYSVVVGSFSVKANAEGLQQRLINAGYPAQIAYNSARNMYRVVSSTFDGKEEAVLSRNNMRSQYPDAWLLMNK